MEITFLTVFCLLSCCELPIVLTRSNNTTDLSISSYKVGEIKTYSHEQRGTLNKISYIRDKPPTGVLSSTRTDGGSDVTAMTASPRHENVYEMDRIGKTKSFLREMHKENRVKLGYQTEKSTVRNEPIMNRSTESPEYELGRVESLPKPVAQVQPTDFPPDFTPIPEWGTSPLEEYEEVTAFIPRNTRPRTPGVKNPFYPVTGESYGAYAVMCISIFFFTVGIVGNIAIMCIVCHNYYMRSISNSLLANLALWDFVILFFCLPLVVFHELTKDWLLGEFSCKIIPYIEVKTYLVKKNVIGHF